MPTKLQSTDIQTGETPAFIGIYGLGGSGKTRLAGTAPKPILIHDYDHKLKSIAGLEDIYIISYDTDPTKALEEFMIHKKVFHDARKGVYNTGNFGDPEPKPFATQVVDGGTSLYHSILNASMLSQGKYSVALDSTDKPDMATYGWYTAYWNGLYATYKSQSNKQWTIITFHEKIIYDNPKRQGDEPSIKQIQPFLGGNLVFQELPGNLEELWHLTRKTIGGKDKVTLRYKPYNEYLCNSTMLEGSGIIENPTFEEILKHVRK